MTKEKNEINKEKLKALEVTLGKIEKDFLFCLFRFSFKKRLHQGVGVNFSNTQNNKYTTFMKFTRPASVHFYSPSFIFVHLFSTLGVLFYYTKIRKVEKS